MTGPPRFCRCSTPDRLTSAEGVLMCAACGEQIPTASDRLLMVVAKQQAAIIERLDRQAPAQTDPSEAGRLISAAELAPRLGRHVNWIRSHADELGARRLGNGRLLFDFAEVLERLAPQNGPSSGAAPKRRPARKRPSASTAPLLEIRGRTATANDER